MSTNDLEASGTRIIATVQQTEQAALDAVRRFVDTVDAAFPDVGEADDGPRRRIIDAAFAMTQNLVSASNQLAENVVQVTARALEDRPAGGGDGA